MIHFFLVQNRQGKTRLAKWYSPFEDAEKNKLTEEVHRLVNSREAKFTNFVEVKSIFLKKCTNFINALSFVTLKLFIVVMLVYFFVLSLIQKITNWLIWKQFISLWKFLIHTLITCASWIWSFTFIR